MLKFRHNFFSLKVTLSAVTYKENCFRVYYTAELIGVIHSGCT